MCWSLLILDVCVFVAVSSFLFATMVLNFGDNCSILLPFFSHGNDVDHAFSSGKMDVLLWNEKKASLFCDFVTSVMILQY
jgi:hypothetical protein